jgi:hypothetical protein
MPSLWRLAIGLKNVATPIASFAFARFDDLYSAAATRIARQIEDAEDRIAESRHRAEGRHTRR